MSLTPQDIQSKQFHVRFRGFDVEEVDGFLEQVAENFLMVQEENKQLKEKLSVLEREVEYLRKDEDSFKTAMISAQSVADGMLKKSREDADNILSQAKKEVQKLKDEAVKEITELEYKIDSLTGALGNLQDELRVVINKYLEMVNDPSGIDDSGQTAMANDVEYSSEDEEIEQEVEPPTSSSIVDEDVDLSDLYEKIDLPAEHPASQELDPPEETYNNEVSLADQDDDAEELQELEEPVVLQTENDDVAQAAIPDLDDEIMFTLEDPLDEEEKSNS